MAFHPDGHLLAAGATDGSINLYDVKTSQLMHTFPASSTPPTAVVGLEFSENGTWLAAATASSSSVTIYDLRKTAVLKVLDVGTAVTDISWDYTGQFLAASGPGGVTVCQYTKSSKAWSEPLRKAIDARAVGWGAKAASLVVLTAEGAVSVLGS